MALNMKKTLKPRGVKTKSFKGYVDVPSRVEIPAGTRGGSAAGMIDTPRKGRNRGSRKGRIKPRSRNY
jgi:hypothetical protein